MFGLSLFVAVYWMLFSGAWLPTIAVAATGGAIAALVSGDPRPLGIALVAGSLLGWLATLISFLTWDYLHPVEPYDTRECARVDLAAWSVGPAVAIVVALAVMPIW